MITRFVVAEIVEEGLRQDLYGDALRFYVRDKLTELHPEDCSEIVQRGDVSRPVIEFILDDLDSYAR